MSDELQYKYILIQRVVSACLSVNWREVLRAEFTIPRTVRRDFICTLVFTGPFTGGWPSPQVVWIRDLRTTCCSQFDSNAKSEAK